MSEILSNTGVKLWSETDYNELWLTVFDQLTGQGGKSNIRLIDEAIGKINTTLDGYKFEFSSDEDRLYISKGDLKLPVSLIDSNGHVASKVDGTTITIDESGVVKGVPVDDALSEESTNPLQNKVIAGELKSIKSKMGTDESAIKQNTSDITSNTKRIEANETAISTLNGTGDGSVKKAVSDGIAEVVAGAPEDFDTLKEMSDWISSHESTASAMNTQIQENKKNLASHTADENIHVTTDDKTKWNKVEDKLDRIGDASNTTVSFTTPSTRENLTTKEKLSIGFGKISKWFSDLKAVAFSGSYNDLSNKPTSLPANGGNSSTVNNHTVKSDVPENAKFTDTTYSDATTTTHGLMSATDKKVLEVLNKPSATCATGRSTAAKVATLSNFTLQIGSTIVVKFTDVTGTSNPTSGNLTLNVNNTGAKTIGYFRNGNKSTLTYTSGNLFYNNLTHIFMYDGTYWLCMDWNADNNTTYNDATASANGLMTSAMVTKLNGIAEGANKTVVDSVMSSSSTNSVQNKVINAALVSKADKPNVYNVTVSSSSWKGTDPPYSTTISVAKATASNIIEVTTPSTATLDKITAIADAAILNGSQASGSVTLKAYGDKPKIDLPLTIIVFG